jgi:hypothetical protein
MFKKIKKLYKILKYFFTDEENLFLHLLEMKAYESLDDCFTLDVSMTEEIEDLIFHIKSYYDIEENLVNTKYPDYKDKDVRKMMKECKQGKVDLKKIEEFADFLAEVEKQRAVERDLIFEEAKILTFGFKL